MCGLVSWKSLLNVSISQSVGWQLQKMVMNTPFLRVRLALIVSLATCSASSFASVLSVAGNDTLVGNRALNLIVNGSFEADGGSAPNGAYWATGTANTPTLSLTGWTAVGQVASYASWGSDGLGGIVNSATFPHGTNGLYFGGGIMASVRPFPMEANNGLVTFTSTPVIVPKPTEAPVTLQQTVSGLNPAATYVLDFWTSGEGIGPMGFAADGFFGLDITGESQLYFASPSGSSPIGNSQRYQVYFKPTATTITFKWINWGHYFLGVNVLSDELVLDDVILNNLSNTNPPINCNCLTNVTVTCPGFVPDLCVQAANCFGTNLLPGSCTQNFPAGLPLNAGTYPLTLQVMDLQSNVYNCTVTFTVLPQTPPPPLTVVCPTNKTVECGSGWSFDSPIILSSCCGVNVTSSDSVVSNGVCSQIITRTWSIVDGCGNMKTCSQTVTTQDTTPPGTQCGQNLVPNPSFEQFTNCPNTIADFNFASPWFTPTAGSTDLFSPCAGVASYVGVPTNSLGVQIPMSGQCYAGAVVWSVYGLNTNNTYRDVREYMEVPLLAPLTGGQKYQVSFYVSRADNYHYAIAEIGAYFSFGPLINPGSGTNFNVVPQVENPSSNLLADTNSWMLVQGTFTAVGGESYLTLGNFRTDANTTYSNFPAGSLPDFAYYYFDDVSVLELCNPMTNKVVQCGDPWTFDNVTPFDNCSGNNVTLTVTTTTNGFCPQVITRTWALADACGNTNLLTQTVTIVDTNPPVLLCGTGANLVPNGQFENYSYCPYFFSQVDAAAPWFTPTVATPDYFNSCSSFAPVSTPANYFGSQAPFSGQGYCGANVYSAGVPYNNAPGGYREYIEAPLLSPLTAGITYQVSFRVSLADKYAWAIAQLGAYFSTGQVFNGATEGVLSYVPQVENPMSNPLTSTNSWMLVQGTFTAVGGEDHITLGNFRTDANTTAVPALGTNNFAYYYIDDVSVTALCSFTNKTVQCGTAWDFDFPQAFDACSGNFLSTTATSTTSNGVCPKIFTRVWTISDACNNSIMATQVVTVVDTTPPMIACSGINLVPNPGFENYANCPDGLSRLDYAWPWYPPTDGSPDFYNSCAPLASTASVPSNFAGVQTPFSGQGYGGGYVYSPGGANAANSYREYLQTPLLAPLIAGQAYAVSFHVSRASNFIFAIAEIGAYLSAGPVTNYGSQNCLAVVPQVVNPSNNVIASASAWTLIQGTYVATGGEDHLTLGNFNSDASTTAQAASGFDPGGYYYYDDVSVVALCTQPTNKMVACGAPWTFDPPTGVDLCSGSNVTVSVVSTITNSLCPLSVTRHWLLTDLCGNSTPWSETVSVTNSSSLAVNCGCLQDASISLFASTACSGIVPNLSVLTNSVCITGGGCGARTITQSPAAGTVLGPGVHNITVNIFSCGGVTNTCVWPFSVNPPLAITCPATIFVFGCSNQTAIVHYAATATGNAGPVVCSPPSGSIFPLGTNTVICTATNSCGGVATCSFNVIVRPVPRRIACITKVIGIITYPPTLARVINLPDFPGGGLGVDLADLTGTSGMLFDLGPAQKFTFSTFLDFTAPEGASFSPALPPDSSHPNGTPLLNFALHSGHWEITANKNMVDDSAATFRSIAIGTNGELFSSFTHTGASLDTNILVRLLPMAGATGAVMTVTLDCRTREVTLEFPSCVWTPDAARNGWDGSIYGNLPPRGSLGNPTANLILTPITSATQTPITTLALLTGNLATLAFDNPSISASGRQWSDGHVAVLQAYADSTATGMEVYSLGDGGGVSADLGHAASFQFSIAQLQDSTVPNLSQLFAVRGWPPGTTTNRPPPPVFNLRLAQNTSGTGGIDCFADFTQWGVSNVTVQLWNGTVLVAQAKNVPATLASTFVTLGGFPGGFSCPSIGVVSLTDKNPIVVLAGLNCSSGCTGSELRIIAELSKMTAPPTAFTGLDCFISADMDNLIYGLQTTPACSPVPLAVSATATNIILDWQGDGFRLQGGETLSGPWYDLGVSAPVTLPANSTNRFFRLLCD